MVSVTTVTIFAYVTANVDFVLLLLFFIEPFLLICRVKYCPPYSSWGEWPWLVRPPSTSSIPDISWICSCERDCQLAFPSIKLLKHSFQFGSISTIFWKVWDVQWGNFPQSSPSTGRISSTSLRSACTSVVDLYWTVSIIGLYCCWWPFPGAIGCYFYCQSMVDCISYKVV